MGVHRSRGAWKPAHICLIPALLAKGQRCTLEVWWWSRHFGGCFKFHARWGQPCPAAGFAVFQKPFVYHLITLWSGIGILAFCPGCTYVSDSLSGSQGGFLPAVHDQTSTISTFHTLNINQVLSSFLSFCLSRRSWLYLERVLRTS